MKRPLLLVVAGVIAIAGCTSEQEGPQTTDVTIHVSDQAGLAVNDLTVVAKKDISDDQVEQINEGRTDGNGNVTLAFPENATVSVGLWKQQPDTETIYTWQTPFIVPVDNLSLSYTYFLTSTTCGVVQPGSSPCPEPSTIEPSAESEPPSESPSEAPSDQASEVPPE